jgi:hypothetical protein
VNLAISKNWHGYNKIMRFGMVMVGFSRMDTFGHTISTEGFQEPTVRLLISISIVNSYGNFESAIVTIGNRSRKKTSNQSPNLDDQLVQAEHCIMYS